MGLVRSTAGTLNASATDKVLMTIWAWLRLDFDQVSRRNEEQNSIPQKSGVPTSVHQEKSIPSLSTPCS